ncbi:MAG: HPP family protein [Planctomycetes bacterium]|nr:HPP family protein [Planctomycetota bacterium]
MQTLPSASSARRSPLALALVSGVAMVLLGAAALALKAPMLFPAIGASAWVVFRHPEAPPAAPRNVLLGHGLGAVIGWIALWGCVGFEARGSLADLAQWQYVASGATALGATVFVLELLRVVHPPAAATTMIVGMGLLPKLVHLAAIVGAALGLVLIARVLRVRASGPV